VKVPLVDLGAQHASIRDEVMNAAREVIERQAFVLGEPVARFEQTLARMVGVGHAVGVASGTDALALALRALGVAEGDAVLTPALTFVASVEAIVAVGARPVFVDVDASLTMDPAGVEAQIASAARDGLRVRALLPVHLFGRCAAMDTLVAIAKRRALVIVEDAAQAIGARCALGAVGAMGDAGAFSFFPSKNLGAWGDGGAVTTNDARVASRVRSLRQHGRTAQDDGGGDVFEERGMNSRLDALHAAVLDVKARHLETWTRARRDAAARYRAMLEGVAELTLPDEPADAASHVYNIFAIRTPHRDALSAHLAARGVASRAYYARPAHRQPAYARFHEGRAPLVHTDAASRELLAIPMFAEITEAQQAYVAEAVRAFFHAKRAQR
jgi:dTDP-4-amino-4,6-dideoxygalactose transaminase